MGVTDHTMRAVGGGEFLSRGDTPVTPTNVQFRDKGTLPDTSWSGAELPVNQQARNDSIQTDA